MAKYVLVQFDNDDDADGFVKTLDMRSDVPDQATMKVVGVFKKPTLFCECTTPSEKSVRGAKWGWWLCRNVGCGKPKRGQFQGHRNLRDPEGTRTEQRRIFINVKEPL